MPLLSFSIDLSRSTKAKTVIDRVASNVEMKSKLLDYYNKIFMQIEAELCSRIIEYDIPLDKLTLVKRLGDEVWFVYDLDVDDNEHSKKNNSENIYKILQMLFTIVVKHHRFFVTEREVYWDEEEKNPNIWEHVNHEEVMMPRKCFVDIMYNYAEYSKERAANIKNGLINGIRIKKLKSGLKADTAEIEAELNQLFPKAASVFNIGDCEVSNGNFHLKNIRFDPIGRDVDWFFRCNKYALPAMIKVGQRLFDYVATEIDGTKMRIAHGQGSSTKYDSYNFIEEIIDKQDLKGIDENYNLYALLDNSSTPQLAVEQGKEDRDGCQESRNFLLGRDFVNQRIENGWLIYSINKDKWTRFSGTD